MKVLSTLLPVIGPATSALAQITPKGTIPDGAGKLLSFSSVANGKITVDRIYYD